MLCCSSNCLGMFLAADSRPLGMAVVGPIAPAAIILLASPKPVPTVYGTYCAKGLASEVSLGTGSSFGCSTNWANGFMSSGFFAIKQSFKFYAVTYLKSYLLHLVQIFYQTVALLHLYLS